MIQIKIDKYTTECDNLYVNTITCLLKPHPFYPTPFKPALLHVYRFHSFHNFAVQEQNHELNPEEPTRRGRS